MHLKFYIYLTLVLLFISSAFCDLYDTRFDELENALNLTSLTLFNAKAWIFPQRDGSYEDP